MLYKSGDLPNRSFCGVMCEWENCKYAEGPSFMQAEDGLWLLASSVCRLDGGHNFKVNYGRLDADGYVTEIFVNGGEEVFSVLL